MQTFKIVSTQVVDAGTVLLPQLTAYGSSEEQACYVWVTLVNANYLTQCNPNSNMVEQGYFCETLLSPDLDSFAALQQYFNSFYGEFAQATITMQVG